MVLFDLEVVFTGICAYVPNVNLDRICIVMPGGGGRFSLDGEYLCPHSSFVESRPASSVQIVRTSLVNYGVALDFESDFPGDNPDIRLPDEGSGPYLARLQTAMGHVPTDTDPGIVDMDPPRVVMAQVFLEKGRFEFDTENARPWRFNPHDGSGEVPKELVHTVTFSLRNIKNANLNFTPIGGNQVRNPISLTPKVQGNVLLRMANTCVDAEGVEEDPREDARDRDFKWYYELMARDTKAALKKDLKARIINGELGELAFPRRRLTNLDNGPNCFSAVLPAVNF